MKNATTIKLVLNVHLENNRTTSYGRSHSDRDSVQGDVVKFEFVLEKNVVIASHV